MSRLTSTAWGLESGPATDTEWRMRSACLNDWARFSDLGPGTLGQAEAAKAKHICERHCPVAADCAKWTAGLLDAGLLVIGVVQAGIRWDDNTSRPHVTQPKDLGCGPHCRHLRDFDPAADVPKAKVGRPAITQHGTATCYGKGCRCELCRHAKAEATQRYYARRSA